MRFQQRFGLGGALCVLLSLTAATGCSKDGDDQQSATQDVGSLDLALSAGGTEITSISYTITGNGFTKQGSIPTTSSGKTFSSLITGIPGGMGYSITLTAKDATGNLMCKGNATFNVTAGQTTSVTVKLQCPGTRKSGSVLVTGEINVCAVVEAAAAASPTASVGVPVDLVGVGSDEDNAPGALTYKWVVKSGPATVAAPAQANTTLTCSAPGTVALELSVTDGDCGDTVPLQVTCGTGPAAGSGATGGSPLAGTGGSPTAGTGGTGGTGGMATGGGGGSCTTGAAQAVTIKWKGVVNGAPFACGQTYTGVGTAASIQVTPQDFRMFVQDLKLVRSDGVDVPVTLDTNAWQAQNTALIDFEDGTGNCGEGGPPTNTVITGTVPSSSCAYTGVKFANGVPDALNHANPAASPAPFSTYPALQWAWLAGYRFTKFEFVQVVTPGQLFGDAYLHSGSTGCSGMPQTGGAVVCAKPNRNAISLSGFNPASSTIVVDMAKAFVGVSDWSMQNECHSSDAPICTPMFSALGVNYGTGQPQAGQTIFSVQ
jgi:uncharacterized repeat protein (TIGR04052 family)